MQKQQANTICKGRTHRCAFKPVKVILIGATRFLYLCCIFPDEEYAMIVCACAPMSIIFYLASLLCYTVSFFLYIFSFAYQSYVSQPSTQKKNCLISIIVTLFYIRQFFSPNIHSFVYSFIRSFVPSGIHSTHRWVDYHIFFSHICLFMCDLGLSIFN